MALATSQEALSEEAGLGEERRPVRLEVGWEKDGEGKPADPSQARLQTSRHAK
jgi:hypothetical protein